MNAGKDCAALPRPNDAYADVEHSLICDNVPAGDESPQNIGHTRPGENQLGSETTPDGCNQCDHEGLDIAEALGLEIKHRQYVQCRDDAPPHQRNPEQKLQ